jgi:acetylornithine/succinyldiaminopimelate/putrescine aminotransferase/predicted amino acid dehydrogenase
MSTDSLYASFVKPRVYEVLSAARLDVVYTRAAGDYLYYRSEVGEEVQVLDLLGGFGASLFGHNHPALVDLSARLLGDRVPFSAQASVRDRAGQLAKRLSDLVGRSTGRAYMVTFANSGAEAVEAAVKHAEMEAYNRRVLALEGLREQAARARDALRTGTLSLAGGLAADDPIHPAVVEKVIADVLRRAEEAFATPPAFLAVAGAFHGKTTGALRLTHNHEYRRPWERLGSAIFVPREDKNALLRALYDAVVEYDDLELTSDNVLRRTRKRFVNVSACFCEPIQGEGGINEISSDYLRALRAEATRHGFPLIIDEIQAGMGRTGTFLASEPSGVVADYYLFAKALGGGVAKIAALLVDQERYIHDFGYLHTSTFAEDDHSCAIGLRCLDLLQEKGERVMRLCREKGDHVIARLRAIANEFPDVISDVRGRGLLVGIEWRLQAESTSPFLRVASEQHLLGMFIAGHLLREHAIRVAPTLSAHDTIRIEPSAEIAYGEIDRACDAIRSVAEAVRAANSFKLARFVVDRRDDRPLVAQDPPPRTVPRAPEPERVGFLVHFLEATDLRLFDSGFKSFSEQECTAFVDRMSSVLAPFAAECVELKSPTGRAVELCIIAVPFTAAQVVAAMSRGSTKWAVDLVRAGVDVARDLGCGLVGFGGYTSIVTDSCRTLVDDRLALTSGNSFTVAAAVEALTETAVGAGLPRKTLGVVGATGNIGAMLAELASDRVDEVVLVGRPGAERRLSNAAQRLRCSSRIATDMGALRECTMIISASNAPRPVILPEHVGTGPVVICDVAAPSDVHPTVKRERPRAIVLKGGIARLPLNQDIRSNGVKYAPGRIYACMAESILLGLAGVKGHFSYGPLESKKIRQIREIAREHDFAVEARASLAGQA